MVAEAKVSSVESETVKIEKEPMKPVPGRIRGLVFPLLIVHSVLLIWSASRHSPSFDEVGHMAAGLSHWELGNFDMYRVNPPLVRLVATLPIRLMGPETNWEKLTDLPGQRPEFEIGRDFISTNGAWSFWLFTVARWMCLPFSLLAGCICFFWARQLYGDAAGVLSLTLWCFCPNVLANAQMIVPDTGAAALGVTAMYCFWKWMREGGWELTFASGVVLGLAELAKATWVLLFAILPALWAVWRLFDRCGLNLTAGRWRELGQLVLMAVLALLVLNLGYGFEGTMQKLGDYNFISEALGGPPDANQGPLRNRFEGSWLADLPVPVPRNYLLGIDHQKRDFEMGMRSYLRGEWRRGGWWYYYLYALSVKVPLGTWILVLLALYVGFFRRGYTSSWSDELVLLAPVLGITALVSSQTGFNHHCRYVLPIFPFAFIWISKVAHAASRGAQIIAVLVSGATIWTVASSLWVYPHSMSYFNELAGGPENGHAHLVDSNIDWGQDLLYLKEWLDKHPEVKPLSLAYFGDFDPRAAGIEFRLPPQKALGDRGNRKSKKCTKGEIGPGWYAVSVNYLRGAGGFPLSDGRGIWKTAQSGAFVYFLECHPEAKAGYSIYIYHLGTEECDRLNRKYVFTMDD